MTTDESSIPSTRELDLLTRIEENPDISQANLASELGVAVGTVNWYLKRLISKGYVKVKRAQRKKLRYIITPEGIALYAPDGGLHPVLLRALPPHAPKDAHCHSTAARKRLRAG